MAELGIQLKEGSWFHKDQLLSQHNVAKTKPVNWPHGMNMFMMTATGVRLHSRYLLVKINRGPITVGKSEENVVILDDTDAADRQFVLQQKGWFSKAWVLQNLAVSIAVVRNGAPIVVAPAEVCALENGDEILVGKAKLLLTIVS